MENWKRALVASSAAASAVLLIKRKKTAGLILAGISLAVLSAEYPEQFARIRERVPDYVERGTRFLDVVSRVGERLAETAESRSLAWYESLLNG